MTAYNKKNDSKQDAKTTKGMTASQKAAFEKLDKKHRKPKSQEDDARIDKKNAAKVRKNVK